MKGVSREQFDKDFEEFWNYHHTRPPHDHHEFDCCESGARWAVEKYAVNTVELREVVRHAADEMAECHNKLILKNKVINELASMIMSWEGSPDPTDIKRAEKFAMQVLRELNAWPIQIGGEDGS